MILALDTLPKFEQDLTQLSNLDTMHELLWNLTMTNEQFISFLQERVYDYIIAFAAQGLSREIDTSFPVLVHLKPALSFLKFDCFLATYETSSAMTAYNILAFPHRLVDEQFRTVEVTRICHCESEYIFICVWGEAQQSIVRLSRQYHIRLDHISLSDN